MKMFIIVQSIILATLAANTQLVYAASYTCNKNRCLPGDVGMLVLMSLVVIFGIYHSIKGTSNTNPIGIIIAIIFLLFLGGRVYSYL